MSKQTEASTLALEALEGIQRYGLDTLSGRVDGPDDREWQRAGVNEMTKRARLGITAIEEALAQQSVTEPHKRTWAGLTDDDKMAFLAQDFGGNRLDAMDWAEKRLKEKNT